MGGAVDAAVDDLAGISKPDPEDCWRAWVRVGEEGESWLTNASADLEKTKPRCCKALVTVWRAREGTRM